jgi:protein ImuA
MARNAAARGTLFALRREIARIEGTLPERLARPEDACGMVAGDAARLRFGIDRLDRMLGGGLARGALTEFHGAETRDAGAVAGLALALAGALLKQPGSVEAPVLWIGAAEVFREAGVPYAAGLRELYGIEPEKLLFSEAPKLGDVLWVAEEAAALTALSAVVLEVRGNSERLDLTATRRLHRRAQAAGRPVFLLRQAAQAEPTAAPVRLCVSPAPAATRSTVAGPLAGSLGRPAFTVAVDKCAAAMGGRFTLEWNPDEHEFTERRTTDPVAMVPLSGDGTGAAAAPGAVVAFSATAQAASGQPAGGQRPPRRRAG